MPPSPNGASSIQRPYCGKTHGHGTGGHIGRWHGHRLSHCVRHKLAPAQRAESELGYFVLDVSPRCPPSPANTPSREFTICLIADLDALFDDMLADPNTDAAMRHDAMTLLIRACIKGVDDDGVTEVLAFWRDNVRGRLALIETEMMEVKRQHPDRTRTA